MGMRTVYVFSLTDSVSQSMELLNKIKALAYLMYDEIKTFDIDNNILCHDNIIYNELLESNHDKKYYYRFKYDNYESGKYEPFMIDDISFGFTVNSDKISYNEIMAIFNHIKMITMFEYDVSVSSYDYMEDRKNINRLNVLKNIISNRKEIQYGSSELNRVLKAI